MTRRRSRLAIAAGSILLLGASCRAMVLDVGTNDTIADAAAPEEAAAADVTFDGRVATLEEVLNARCAALTGRADDYHSALQATQRIIGRWFACGPPAAAPINDGTGVGVVFDRDGGWALLDWNAARDGFSASTVDNDFGEYSYHMTIVPDSSIAADGGGGSDGAVEQDVDFDDPTLRNGLLLHLGHSDHPDPLNVEFRTDPRQMTAAEQGPSPNFALYVPID